MLIRVLLLLVLALPLQAEPLKIKAVSAQRIISLAPHITEILFEVGAGEQVVGTVNYSNYPEEAMRIPQVGGYNRLDLEAILQLQPDLILGWESGNSTAEIERLRALGLPIRLSEPHRLEDIATLMEQFGALTGHVEQGRQRAELYRQRLQQLRSRYTNRPPVTVFYQVWNQPLITINGEQVISDVIALCGGINVFADLSGLSPRISVEAVLQRNPQVIIASGMDASRPEWLDEWRRYPVLGAVAGDNLYHVPPDILQRHGPRLVDGAEQLCLALEEARSKMVRDPD